ncbi:hypothetical protein DFQ26_004172 [Actinomortierella ambigua]|nr:hypothetical protein DFQ26_004172 [Actinomortierella ambigua]
MGIWARAQQYDLNAQQQQDWIYVWTQWRKDWDTWQLLLQEKKPVATDDAPQMQTQAFAEYVQNMRFHIPQIISANACFLNSAVVGEMDLMKDLVETATRGLGLEDDLETLDAEQQEHRRWLEQSITDLNNFSSKASTKQYQREPGPGNVSGVLNRGARAGSPRVPKRHIFTPRDPTSDKLNILEEIKFTNVRLPPVKGGTLLELVV